MNISLRYDVVDGVTDTRPSVVLTMSRDEAHRLCQALDYMHTKMDYFDWNGFGAFHSAVLFILRLRTLLASTGAA